MGTTWRARLADGLSPLPISGAEEPETIEVPKADMDKLRADLASSNQAAEKARKDALAATRRFEAGNRLFAQMLEALGIETLPDDEAERDKVLADLRKSTEEKRRGRVLTEAEVRATIEAAEKKHRQALDEIRTAKERREAKLREVMVRNAALAAATDHRATAGGVDVIAMMVDREADVVEEDGELVPIVKGRDGPRLNAKGERMTIAERVAEIAADQKYAGLFQAAPGRGGGSGGGGSPPPAGAKPRMTKEEIQALPIDERVATQRKVLKGEIQLVG